jgi:DNA (cytosine-5)-methyltransferase 1
MGFGSMKGLDLFCGARGWEAVAHRSMGVDLLGVEWWEPAVRTSEAAGLRVLHADVAALDPLDFAAEVGEDGILVASPPCQSRSAAGKGLGKLDVPQVTACLQELAEGRDTRAERKAACQDERSILTVEPLRWALALRPRVVLLEQVPPVLPDWKLVGSLLERVGYSWWAGVLEAERYGVPQTRERAVLIARRDGRPAAPPSPTHHRFVPNEPRPDATVDLFGEVLPWVSMAEALGWGMTERPSVTVAANNGREGSTGGARDTIAGGTGARATLKRERERGAWAAIRPATTIAGDQRVFQPGGHHQPGEQSENAIRVTVEQAACLQSFPPDWPWHGDPAKPNSRTAQFTLIGNAVPPLLGEAIFRAVMDGESPIPR